MFTEITMIDYSRPLPERAATRKVVGPYRWRPTKAPSNGRGFYQASKGLRMDPRGSTLDLRIEHAEDWLPRRRGATFRDWEGDAEFNGIVARLPHGRGFLAGWSMGEGMIGTLDAYIWRDIESAARAARDMAEQACADEIESRERGDDFDA